MLMKHFLFFTLLLSFTFSANAQIGAVIGNDNKHNEYLSKRNKAPFSTAKLAFAITKNATTDTEKVSAIYKWIASNISYDNELRLNSELQKEFYTSEENVMKKVLDRKMALCGGYAFLFKSLCADVRVSAEVIHGFTKDYSGKVQKNKKPNHTWNAVKLNGQWQLLDITWAIGYGNNNKTDDFWFLIKPTDFILSHFPQERKWTLLNNPISFSDFQKQSVK